MIHQIEVTDSLIIAIVLTILFLITTALFIYQTIRHNRRAYILTVGIIFGVFAGFFTILYDGSFFTGELASWTLRLELISWSFLYFFVYLFIEELESTQPNSIRLSVASFLFGGFLVFSVLSMSPQSTNEIVLLWDFFYNALGAFAFGFGAFSFIQAYYVVREKYPLIQGVGMISVVIGFILAFYGDMDAFYLKTGLDLGIFPDVLKIVGLLLFIFIYLYKIDYLYRLPVQVISIAIYSTSGLPIYIAKAKGRKLMAEIDHMLLGGMFQALNDIMQKATGSIHHIKELSNRDRVITFYAAEKITLAVTASRSTHFLENAMKSATKLFEEHYTKELTHELLNTEEFKETGKILSKAFPFLEIEDIN